MLDKIFGGDALFAATHALDAASLRQQVISNNLANTNTPGYKRQTVHFESSLQAALDARSNPFTAGMAPALGSVHPEIETLNTTSERADGNNVDPEMENTSLALNAIRYDALTQLVSMNFSNLKTAINGR